MTAHATDTFLSAGETTFLVYAFVAAFLLLTVVAVAKPLTEQVRARRARYEAEAFADSGDLADLMRAVAEDEVNERFWAEAVDLGNSARVSGTPLHDLYRRRYDEFGRDLARIHNLDEYRGGDAS